MIESEPSGVIRQKLIAERIIPVIMLMLVFSIHPGHSLKGQATLMATTTPKRRKWASSFEIEPIYTMSYTSKGRRLIRAVHMPMWRVLGRKHYAYALTYHTHAVLPERMWMRVFAGTRGRE